MKILKNICGVLVIYLCIGLITSLLMVRTSNIIKETPNNNNVIVIKKQMTK